ncbi:MAG: M12 family metallo-peptidase [Chryseobacterium sp.]|uniref:zinc-dependent metalloprotease n=1 Tax=Chryseobacterium sp. TaxID=1871047 RepID=UPI0025BCADE9|nr:zinc-dependent metalloprotease family protein [Chryseobacterium sp.]MCJ7934422.1 M12 family metallo-peptidase [Chryseobacterium sp.]
MSSSKESMKNGCKNRNRKKNNGVTFLWISSIGVTLLYKIYDMKMKLLCLPLAFLPVLLSAQWSKSVPKKDIAGKREHSVYYKLDIDQIRAQLMRTSKLGEGSAITIRIPTLEGRVERFAIHSFPVMDEALAEQYQLGSYVGVGIDDPSKYIRFSVAPDDFQSMVIGSEGKYEFIESAAGDKPFYSVHGKTNRSGHAFVCSTNEGKEAVGQMKELQNYSDQTAFTRKSSHQKFQTLRLALSTTGEYTRFFGGLPGAMAQINATLTRVNGVFEQEFNVHVNMINNTQIIFADPDNDPYSKVMNLYFPPSAWNTQLMNTLHGGMYGVTDADFDIGHLFGASGGGGNAGCIGCVCNNSLSVGGGANFSYKGSGITSPGVDYYAGGTWNSSSTAQLPPSGDSFDIDFVAHEMGHQLGNTHTYSYNDDAGSGTKVEPGSGSTIMGYAGITGASTDVQKHSDLFFHSVSIDQVQANLLTGARANCGTITAITNNPPVVTAMPTTYTIPKSTAFVLTANATDPDGDVLTYSWEQVNPSSIYSGITKSNIGNTTSGANFRSWAPATSPTRYFPKLSTVLGGAVKNAEDFEAASTVARTTNFRVTVRDNRPGQAQTAYADQTIIVGSAAAFTVDTASLTPNTTSEITWTVSGTTAPPYNVSDVKIDYTYDNGAAWHVLAASVPNSGTASVYIPASLAGKNIHLRVSAIGNVFYAVKNIVVAGVLAVSEAENLKSVQIYPNPVDDVLNVTHIAAKSAYEIFNAPGQLISKGIIGDGKIDVRGLMKGVYFITISNNGENIKTKFVKK